MNLTKQSKANGGFTLVELIVVIAILAILAAVAIPAYSGYIEKANRAGDEQLLAAVNRAFASACLQNGTDAHLIKGASIDWGTDGKKTVKGAYVTSKGDPVDVAFDLFFQGNENTEFKVIKYLAFSQEVGAFVDVDSYDGVFSFAYGNGTVVVDSDAIKALVDSTYGDIGAEALLNQVNTVAGVAQGMATMDNLMNTEEYVKYALAALGEEYPGTFAEGQELLYAKVNELALQKAGITEKLEDLGANDPRYDVYVSTLDAIQGNALVLYTAQTATQMTTEDAMKLMDGLTIDTIMNNMSATSSVADQTKGVNQAALAYGMYYAYVNSDKAPAGANKNPGSVDVINALDDEDFKKYMDSEQGKKDMEAYLKALGVVNSSAQGNDSAVETLLVNGFNDPELVEILKGTMGN